ncbi:MAG: hypothetical protein ACE5H1_09955 [Thermodesulfobacteriota bacterium]
MICAICQTSIQATEVTKKCEKCQSEYHVECWNEIGGCGTYGCEMAVIQKIQSEQAAGYTYWGMETKVCPMCGETIKIDELRCPHCKESFDTIAPISREEIKRKFKKWPRKIEENKGALSIFIFAVFGITAPFVLVFGGLWYKENRQILREESPLYNLLALVGLSVSGFYLFLMLLGIFLS